MIEDILLRTCTKCKVDKPLEEFHKFKRNKNGHKTECAKCSCNRVKKYYRENRISIHENQKQYRSKNIEKSLYYSARRRAKKYDILFDIEISDISIPDICPILKVPLIRNTKYAPSLDRIIPDLGYTKGNIWVISKVSNQMKSDSNIEERRKFAEWVLQ